MTDEAQKRGRGGVRGERGVLRRPGDAGIDPSRQRVRRQKARGVFANRNRAILRFALGRGGERPGRRLERAPRASPAKRRLVDERRSRARRERSTLGPLRVDANQILRDQQRARLVVNEVQDDGRQARRRRGAFRVPAARGVFLRGGARQRGGERDARQSATQRAVFRRRVARARRSAARLNGFRGGFVFESTVLARGVVGDGARVARDGARDGVERLRVERRRARSPLRRERRVRFALERARQARETLARGDPRGRGRQRVIPRSPFQPVPRALERAVRRADARRRPHQSRGRAVAVAVVDAQRLGRFPIFPRGEVP